MIFMDTPRSLAKIVQIVSADILSRARASIICCLAILLPAQVSAAEIPATDTAKTAAETDWVPSHLLTEEQRALMPWYCNGAYQQPLWLQALPAPVGASDNTDIATTASADNADYAESGGTTLQGDVIIRRGDGELKADLATLNKDQTLISLEGNVAIRQPGLLIKGSRGQSDLVTNQSELQDASFVIHSSSGARGQAREILRTANNQVSIKNGNFTRCEPGDNFWTLEGDQIDLKLNAGYGTARNVTIRVKDVPVFYAPYLKFPIQDQRTSGFLSPSLGHDSEGGSDLSISYYFNLAPNYDATYTPRSIWKRGLLNEAQARFLTPASENEINAAFMSKDDLFDDRDEILIDSGNSNPVNDFQAQDRWFVNLRHAGNWGKNFATTVRYNRVSDDDYLRDFGATVDSASAAGLTRGLDQSIGNRRTAALDQLAEVSYQNKNWNAVLRTQAYQTLESTAAENYERLPQMLVNYRNTASDWRFELDSEFVSFRRDNDALSGLAKIVGERMAIDSRIALKKKASWGFIEPAVFFKHRQYKLADTQPETNNNPKLSAPGISIDGGLYFDRTIEVQNRKLRQTLEPRMYFLWVSDKDQQDLPEFDAIRLTPSYRQLFRNDRFGGKDRVGDARQLTLGLTSHLFEQETGVERLKTSIGQVYYFQDRSVGLSSDPDGITNASNTSAIFSEIQVKLFRNLRINAMLEWDPTDNRTNRRNLTVRYTDSKRRIFNLGYSYTHEDVQNTRRYQNLEESDVSFLWPISGKWSLTGRWNFGWDENQTIESLLGIEYNDCCWRARMIYRRYLKDPRTLMVTTIENGSSTSQLVLDNRAETGIFIEFELKGLTTVGQRLDALLNESIIGYSKVDELYEH